MGPLSRRKRARVRGSRRGDRRTTDLTDTGHVVAWIVDTDVHRR
jgi:hypothetical protein